MSNIGSLELKGRALALFITHYIIIYLAGMTTYLVIRGSIVSMFITLALVALWAIIVYLLYE